MKELVVSREHAGARLSFAGKRELGRWRQGKAPRPEPPAAELRSEFGQARARSQTLPPRMRSPEGEALWSQFPLERTVEDRGQDGVKFGGSLGL